VTNPFCNSGLDLMKDSVNVDCSYDMTPEQLCAKVSLVDALIIRSGTKASLTFPCQG
jgi:D-3-phosphoglycerate dehydrogenase